MQGRGTPLPSAGRRALDILSSLFLIPAGEAAFSPLPGGENRLLQLAKKDEKGSLSERKNRSLLVNLIGNAVKYNRDGGTVGIQASRLDGKARIDVADNGLGIQAQNLPHIFDDFFREKRKETRDIEGNGLGLAIVKRLVERSSGKIEVQSTEGVGSTFSVYLPLNPSR
jgi:signal transduction histidine kinase